MKTHEIFFQKILGEAELGNVRHTTESTKIYFLDPDSSTIVIIAKLAALQHHMIQHL